jgi:uncharacterized protein (DUF3084 family)
VAKRQGSASQFDSERRRLQWQTYRSHQAGRAINRLKPEIGQRDGELGHHAASS